MSSFIARTTASNCRRRSCAVASVSSTPGANPTIPSEDLERSPASTSSITFRLAVSRLSPIAAAMELILHRGSRSAGKALRISLSPSSSSSPRVNRSPLIAMTATRINAFSQSSTPLRQFSMHLSVSIVSRMLASRLCAFALCSSTTNCIVNPHRKARLPTVRRAQYIDVDAQNEPTHHLKRSLASMPSQ